MTPTPSERLSDFDIHLFREGRHYRLFEKLGAHVEQVEGVQGTTFAVWAPNASSVSVIGDFNGWNPEEHKMLPRWDHSGIWELFIPGASVGQTYKYRIRNAHSGEILEKGDPFAYAWEIPPQTASVIADLNYEWKDSKWMRNRPKAQSLDKAWSVYEVHLGSWRRNPEDGYRSLSYRELAVELVDYVKEMGFTHVEMMPVMEHPFFGSWGYQVTGFFAPSSRYGTPADFKFLIDSLHQAGIGVILDWVPSHFPDDPHGLGRFDGTRLYEHDDPRQGFHPDWKSLIFNYGRLEVREFLISSAMFWLQEYHIDALRVDAVASMLYLDYSRNDGEWIPNRDGGNENHEAISFLRELNETCYREIPGIQMIAEESTAWPGVSRPTDMGGLGFGMKWMMGWMHDTLQFLGREPIHRQYHHGELTFSLVYAFHENFMLPLSHDEVVHGKGSLLDRMPGDDWQRFANLRLLFGHQFTHPGTKMVFMGGEWGQPEEWNHDGSLHWHQLEDPKHRGVSDLMKELNKLYQKEPALHALAFDSAGFEWIDHSDADNGVIAFVRHSGEEEDDLVVLMHVTPAERPDYRIGMPSAGTWRVLLNTDDPEFGGAGVSLASKGRIKTEAVEMHGRDQSIALNLPPLGLMVFKKIKQRASTAKTSSAKTTSAKKETVKKPATKKAAAKKPAAKMPADKKATEKKPAAKKASAKKSTKAPKATAKKTAKPASKKSASTKKNK